ncbi:TPA: type 4 pilus assembly protein PilG [Neisseria meningitidis]|jgi:Type II secretory pathway, component PulF|uniref:Pilus assembly protein PilG n=11 Tax=Neisseria meningitidis TaxID=487 RepID=Q7DDR1_NEIMB|nr:type 4 pilus assembly protein PilG [Neisseria meningitidis]AJC63586.1 type II secretion system protein F [Neisseria meningitidis LNP21362]EOB88577.1 type II secretion system (T2SS), F family protein [Neisseria meningitidis NM604]EOC25295.1 type II secretion system (T2SS), F family protein [Neisseria meningitidis NM3147]EOC43442.1 type II secretion system (T2SS), F family protein [Neisseria meningitidis 2005079]EQD08593.1 type II secretion system (T2SS), F family protein [Neisseria meningiti
MAKNGGFSLFAKKEKRFIFEGRHSASDKLVNGEVSAFTEEEARKKLAKRGIRPLQITRVKTSSKRKITQEDITVFTRQLSTMIKAGLPLMQAFEIVARGHGNPSMTEMLMEIRGEVEQGSSLSRAFSNHPKYFDRFYCNLVAAGETGGVLESLLDKLAIYKEKTQAIRKKVKTALTYPVSVIAVAIGLVFVMMIFVLPAFKEVYANMGAELPALTQTVMDMSDFFVSYGWMVLIALGFAIYGFLKLKARSIKIQRRMDAILLRMPIFGDIVRKGTIARWGRTTATLIAAGVPLVDVLDSTAGAAGNLIYEEATREIRTRVIQGLSMTSGMRATELFPNMMLQMSSIGEESGSLDDMLNKAAEFYEDEVDNAVGRLSAMMEPIIIVILGLVIGTLLVAMYLPLFNLGNVVA